MSRLTAGERNALGTARRCAAAVEYWNKTAVELADAGLFIAAQQCREHAVKHARHAFTILAVNRSAV